MTIERSVSRRIAILRALLIMSVAFLHIGTPDVSVLDQQNAFELLRFFIQDEMGRFAVPTLTLVSGYLLFSSGLYTTPLKLYKKKISTLLVPFLFFNVAYFAVQYAIEYGTGWAPLYVLTDKPDLRNFNYLFSYSAMPLNGALHFLRDLLMLVLLAPLFGWFMRRMPLFGLVLVTAIFMSDMDGRLVNRSTMAVLFYVGGLAAVKRWDVKRFDHLAIPALVLLVLVCIATMYYRIENLVYIYLAAPCAVWPASSLLLNTSIGNLAEKYSKYSFFLFLTHTPLIRVAENLCVRYGRDLCAIEYTMLTFMFLIVFAPMLYMAAMRVMPETFRLLIGGRTAKVRPVDTREPVGIVLANG
jgi:succinoglycan biosynthesis protein ExoH